MPEVLGGKPRVSSGRRDKWVEIEQQASAPAGGSYPVETWTSLGFAWMSRLDLRADERFRADQDTAFAETQWQMPYRSDMDPDTLNVPATRRLKFKGRVYNIQSAHLMDRRIGIELITIAKVG